MSTSHPHDCSPATLHEPLMPSLGGMLGRVHRQWRMAITTAVKPLGITEARWTVMVHLSKLGEGCTQGALAADLGIEMPSLSRTVSQLEAQQLIERRGVAGDRRARSLWFTPAGIDCLRELESRIESVRQHLYRGLSDERLNAITDSLGMIEVNARQLIRPHEPKERS
ncbi:MarR family transcriptional regulator [Onishia taeanensis]|uniref:MarR family transcriptional regulator n=2 Tax=Halomonadaceae TaxID=28256 RepID=A0A328Y4S7_9GAMM|nr:MarR family transcriptional regulator [Halomonas taeanensis]RAR64326.1 MarR family transcriptional regulator [Halomonas taeanensis]